jgi:hypothetical protein
MEEHDHIVGLFLYDDDICSGRKKHAADVSDEWKYYDEEDRFAFCPDCGAPLAEYWTALDASRAEAERLRQLRYAESDAYRDTPPT